MSPIEFVGLDVRAEFLKPGKYLAASYMNDEAEQYSPYEWVFKLKGNLQITYEYLDDTEHNGPFGAYNGNAWRIYFVGAAGQQVDREFSDIVLFEVEALHAE